MTATPAALPFLLAIFFELAFFFKIFPFPISIQVAIIVYPFLPIVCLAEDVVPDTEAVVVEELTLLGGPTDLHDPAGHDQHFVIPTAWQISHYTFFRLYGRGTNAPRSRDMTYNYGNSNECMRERRDKYKHISLPLCYYFLIFQTYVELELEGPED